MKIYTIKDKGLQTAVRDTWKGVDIGNFQVNTFDGEHWIIRGNVEKEDIEKVKAMQLKQIEVKK